VASPKVQAIPEAQAGVVAPTAEATTLGEVTPEIRVAVKISSPS
jgi:hypothetical protein